VLVQTVRPAEIILVDDFSDDAGETLAVLHQMQRLDALLPIRVISMNQNGGPGTARNAAWDMSVQKYIAFLDSDDSWHPQKLEIQWSWMSMHPRVALSGHGTSILTEHVAPPEIVTEFIPQPIRFNRLLWKNRFPTRSVMLLRDIPLRFNPGKRYAEDFLLWLKIAAQPMETEFIPVNLAFSFKQDFGESGLTADMWKFELGELDCYRQLYSEQAISWMKWMGLVCVSLLKHAIRCFKVWVRKSGL
jgi:glycosyltransferase involved in cell wall biosynthesis